MPEFILIPIHAVVATTEELPADIGTGTNTDWRPTAADFGLVQTGEGDYRAFAN